MHRFDEVGFYAVPLLFCVGSEESFMDGDGLEGAELDFKELVEVLLVDPGHFEMHFGGISNLDLVWRKEESSIKKAIDGRNGNFLFTNRKLLNSSTDSYG